jgi:hypothetical protein
VTGWTYSQAKPHDVIWNQNFAYLGTGLPYAVGASVADGGKRPVMLVTGDSSFQFQMAELETAARLNLPRRERFRMDFSSSPRRRVLVTGEGIGQRRRNSSIKGRIVRWISTATAAVDGARAQRSWPKKLPLVSNRFVVPIVSLSVSRRTGWFQMCLESMLWLNRSFISIGDRLRRCAEGSAVSWSCSGFPQCCLLR